MRKYKFLQRVIVLILGFAIAILTVPKAMALVKDDFNQNESGLSEDVAIYPPHINGLPSEDKPPKPKYAPGEIIVKFKEEAGAVLYRRVSPVELSVATISTGLSSIDSLNTKHKVKKIDPVFKKLKQRQLRTGMTYQAITEEIKNKFPQRAARAPRDAKAPNLANIYKLTSEDKNTNILAICEEYKKDPNVEYAEPNYIVKVQEVPNDPYYSSSGSWGQDYDDLWGMKKISCENAWDISKGKGVIVAVVDTGIEYFHEDIAENVSGIEDVYIRILSQIGHPIDQPLIASAQVIPQDGANMKVIKSESEAIIDKWLADITKITEMITRGELDTF